MSASVITQNVDGLHQRAGSTRLIELHGNIHTVRCLACQRRQPRAELQQRLLRDNPALGSVLAQPLPDGDAQLEPESLEHFVVPACEACGGVLQPDVVFFGDNIPPERTRQALAWMDEADALLVVGSSLMVFSGYRFCKLAAAAGKPIAAVNAGKTRADELISLKLALPAQQVLPAVAGLFSGCLKTRDCPGFPSAAAASSARCLPSAAHSHARPARSCSAVAPP
jgi:NAD-dependent SIR2 family protein deacetylase